jgi:hypothetical protein
MSQKRREIKLPDPVTTYEDLLNHVKSWVDPNPAETPRLVILGRGGLGKSYQVEKLRRVHRFVGKTSPYSLFTGLQEEPEQSVIFDDVYSLLRNKDCLDMMKQLLHRNHRRTMHWKTDKLDVADQTFTFTGKVLIIANSLPSHNEDLAAIFDRCDVIEFCPTKSEIIAVMETMTDDKDAIEIFRSLPILPSLRDLEKYLSWKASKYLDANKKLMLACPPPKQVVLLVDIFDELKTKGKWIEAYQERSGKTYEAARSDIKRYGDLARQIIDARTSKVKELANV